MYTGRIIHGITMVERQRTTPRSDVDWCEKKENEQNVLDINVGGTANVCEMADKHNCPVILLSSDHVFSGKRWFGAYKENDIPSPVNFYGFSKFGAEIVNVEYPDLKVIRTSYLFDRVRLAKDINLLKADIPVPYPTFLRRSFLYFPHFISLVMEYCKNIHDQPDILHLSGCDTVSWYQFMRDVAIGFGIDPTLVRPRKKDLRNGFADRGYRLGLDTSLSAELGFTQYSYKQGIQEMVNGTAK